MCNTAEMIAAASITKKSQAENTRIGEAETILLNLLPIVVSTQQRR